MKWSIKLGKLLGIDVYLHFTFLLLLAFLGFTCWRATQNVAATLQGVAFIVALFGCVVLHELGHALMARRYGIKTRDITLLPIGGIARLEKMPEKPMQEFWVAVAGQAVNVAIAAVLFVGLAVTGGFTPPEEITVTSGSFWQRLMVLNIFLVAFNLLPAFPMDGGRILRALLSTRLGRRRATAIAANVGQGMAILFVIVGFLYNPFLIFIGIFVYLGAQAEAGSVEMQSALEGLRVRDAMMTRFRTLATQDPLAKAVQELLAAPSRIYRARKRSTRGHPPPQRSGKSTFGRPARGGRYRGDVPRLRDGGRSGLAERRGRGDARAAMCHDPSLGRWTHGRTADARKHQRDDHGQRRNEKQTTRPAHDDKTNLNTSPKLS